MDEDIRENIGPVPRYLASTNRQPILVAIGPCDAARSRRLRLWRWPGRGLISPYPESDRGKLDEGEVIGGELVIAGGDTPALLNLTEEPIQQVTRPVRDGD